MANRKILAIRDWMSLHPFMGLKDIIVAYSSLTVYYDPHVVKKRHPCTETVFGFVHHQLELAFQQADPPATEQAVVIRIPVCYAEGFAADMGFLSTNKQLSREEIIHLHLSRAYRVYMIGFLPGFSYLGQIDSRLAHTQKLSPVAVAAGSVGLAGGETGIYPLPCPGGWQIIGRTPVKMFDPLLENPVVLNVGDQVQFYEIGKDEFEAYGK